MRGGELREALEVPAVAFQRVIGETALDPEVRQIGVDEIVGG